jgi:hypothetical protein
MALVVHLFFFPVDIEQTGSSGNVVKDARVQFFDKSRT